MSKFKERIAEISKAWRADMGSARSAEAFHQARADAKWSIIDLLRNRPDEAAGENATELAMLIEDVL